MIPSHLRGESDFPSDYRARLRWGSKEDRTQVNQEIIDTFPVRNIGGFIDLLAQTYGDRIALHEPTSKEADQEKVLTYHQFSALVRSRALDLLRVGVRHGERVGIVSENNVDALVLKFACAYIGAIVLPWTERIEEAGMTTAEAMERARVPWLALHRERSIRHILEADVTDFPHIGTMKSHRHIIGVDRDDNKRICDEIGTPPVHGIEPSEFSSCLEQIAPSDTAFIFYSPGTGGMSSKMVEVSHGSMLYQYCVTPGVLHTPPGVRYLHVLPPYHIFGETMLGMVLSMGGEVTLADLRRLVKGDQSLLVRGQFELFSAIPEFWRKIRVGIQQKLPAFLHLTIEEDMVRVAWTDIERARLTGNPLLIEQTDRYWKEFLEEYARHAPKGSVLSCIKAGIRAAMAHLLYPGIRKRAGIGSLRWGISGGAKLRAEDYAFFSALKGSPDSPGIELHSGYGLTEAGVVSISDFTGQHFAASVGHVVPGSAAWTELTEEGHEEICIAGPGVARYRDPTLQHELIPDQVLHTGDQGKVIEIKDQVSGAVRQLIIHERQLKRMIKWKGASMLPAPMEALLKESPLIDDALILGDGQDRLGVLIFPNRQAVEELCGNVPMNGFNPHEPDWDHPGLRALFQKEVESRMRITVTKQRGRIDSFRIMGELPHALRMASGTLHPRKTEEYFAAEIRDFWNKKKFALDQ